MMSQWVDQEKMKYDAALYHRHPILDLGPDSEKLLIFSLLDQSMDWYVMTINWFPIIETQADIWEFFLMSQ